MPPRVQKFTLGALEPRGGASLRQTSTGRLGPEEDNGVDGRTLSTWSLRPPLATHKVNGFMGRRVQAVRALRDQLQRDIGPPGARRAAFAPRVWIGRGGSVGAAADMVVAGCFGYCCAWGIGGGVHVATNGTTMLNHGDKPMRVRTPERHLCLSRLQVTGIEHALHERCKDLRCGPPSGLCLRRKAHPT